MLSFILKGLVLIHKNVVELPREKIDIKTIAMKKKRK